MQHIHASYFFDRNHAIGASIANAVEKALQKHYPSCQVTVAQDAYDQSGRPLYIVRVACKKLTEPVIRDILNFSAGAIAVAKDLVR